jgi:hypothetical protein
MSLIRKTRTIGTCQGFPLRCLLVNHSILVRVVSISSYDREMHVKPILTKAKATYPLKQEATILTHTPHIKFSDITRTSNDILKEHLFLQDPAFFIFLHSKEHVGSRMIAKRKINIYTDDMIRHLGEHALAPPLGRPLLCSSNKLNASLCKSTY